MSRDELKDLGACVEDLVDRVHFLTAGDQAGRRELEAAAQSLLRVRDVIAAAIGRRDLEAAREVREGRRE